MRDFLASTIRRLDTLFTWDISRWNYARHFVVPYRGGREGIATWEDRLGIWEADGAIAGVVNGEIPVPGIAFLQLDPRHEAILDDMISHAEQRFAVNREGRPQVTIAVHDPFHDRFGDRLAARGYLPSAGEPEWMSERPIRPEAVALPAGFCLRSMADTDDVEARRTVLGLAFGHADPAEWVTAETYRELQRAPDYRRDLDLYVVAPDGAFAACCIAWHDPVNRVGTFETGRHAPRAPPPGSRSCGHNGRYQPARRSRRHQGVGGVWPGILWRHRVLEEIQGNNLEKAALSSGLLRAFVIEKENCIILIHYKGHNDIVDH